MKLGQFLAITSIFISLTFSRPIHPSSDTGIVEYDLNHPSEVNLTRRDDEVNGNDNESEDSNDSEYNNESEDNNNNAVIKELERRATSKQTTKTSKNNNKGASKPNNGNQNKDQKQIDTNKFPTQGKTFVEAKPNPGTPPRTFTMM